MNYSNLITENNNVKATLLQESKISRPTFYYPQKWALASIAHFFEKPHKYLDSFATRTDQISSLALLALKICGSIGLAINRMIYFISSERIKQSDYENSFAEWCKKDFGVCKRSQAIKKFIDT